MHLTVFLSAVGFNLINGASIGMWLAGGGGPALSPRPSFSSSSGGKDWGIDLVELTGTPTPLFFVGVGLFVLGLVGNIYSDEVLYSLKRQKLASAAKLSSTTSSFSPSPSSSPQSRYAVPTGFLYSYPFSGISHPSYFCEWIEWSGFLLAALSCQTGVFPAFAWDPKTERRFVERVWDAVRRDPRRIVGAGVPSELRPWREWWLQG